MEPPKITATHERLAALAGRWRGREERAASPWAPGGPAEATLELRRAAAGFVLVEDYASRRDGRPDLSGHGVFSVDPETEDVLWHWFDSIGFAPGEPARGSWAGDRLVLERSSPRGTNRTTWSVEGGELQQTVAFRAPDDDDFAVLLHGRYARDP
jgi:Protein of unknown function (DUF1579)